MRDVARKSVDWQGIGRLYRTSDVSVRAISRIHGVSHTAINRRIKKAGWKRCQVDGPRALRGRHDSGTGPAEPLLGSFEGEQPSEKVRWDLSPEKIKDLDHETLVRHGRESIYYLFQWLKDVADDIDSFHSEIEDYSRENAISKRRYNAMHKAISLLSLSVVAKNLARAAKLLSEQDAEFLGGKKARQQRRAEELARNSPFAVRQPPPRQTPRPPPEGERARNGSVNGADREAQPQAWQETTAPLTTDRQSTEGVEKTDR